MQTETTNPFIAWLKSRDEKALAAKLGCSFWAVRKWKAGKIRPKPELYAALLRLGRGKFKLEDITGSGGAR